MIVIHFCIVLCVFDSCGDAEKLCLESIHQLRMVISELPDIPHTHPETITAQLNMHTSMSDDLDDEYSRTTAATHVMEGYGNKASRVMHSRSELVVSWGMTSCTPGVCDESGYDDEFMRGIAAVEWDQGGARPMGRCGAAV